MFMGEFRYFVSYARKDTEFVLKLATELRAVGVTLWLDQLDILGGQRWDRAIAEALETCEGMIAVLSPEALASNNMMDEVSYALDKGKMVVPVVHQPCDIPFRLGRIHRIDFTVSYDTGFSELLRALHVEHSSSAPTPTTPEHLIGMAALENGIEAIYPPRRTGRESAKAIEAMLKDTNGEILLQGISLRQFFHTNGFLPTIWKKIMSTDDFKIKALLLYPFGDAARSRLAAEESIEGKGGEEFESLKKLLETCMFVDIQRTVSTIININSKCPQNNFVEAKFYECTPFSFFIITKENMIIEQYHFGRQEYATVGECIGALVPLICTNNTSAFYNAMRSSFYHLWNSDKNNVYIKTRSLENVHKEIEESRSKGIWPE
jgi:hypothetical protein